MNILLKSWIKRKLNKFADTIKNVNPMHVLIAAVIIALIISNIYFIYQFNKVKGDIVTNQEPNTVVVDTSGKLLTKKEADNRDTVSSYVANNNKHYDIAYTAKEIDPATGEKEATDVELNTEAKPVTVKVNGKTHQLESEVKETQKFENGKVVVDQQQSTTIEIKAPKPSKWTATALYGGDRYGAGVGYAITRNVKADAMVIDGHPYLGVTVSIGSMN